uniref:Uncharacterized protein n=1 Tax=Knipowitschia caucasica TaxID=637954 RepID=A0AAV2LUU5_KNICA
MDDGRTTAELGNYFSPPSKVTQEEERRTKGLTGQKISPTESINPVPKPRRTFQHPSHSGTLPEARGTCRPCPPIRPVPPAVPEKYRMKRLRPLPDKENPYEDIELESSCSQQSLASSPGADTNKTELQPEFGDSSSPQCSAVCEQQKYKRSHIQSSAQPPHAQDPRSPKPNSRPHCDTSNSRTCQRTPTVSAC